MSVALAACLVLKCVFTDNGHIDAIAAEVNRELFDGVGLGQRRRVQCIQRRRWFVVGTGRVRAADVSGGVWFQSTTERHGTQR